MKSKSKEQIEQGQVEPHPILLSVKQAARACGVSRALWYQLLASGRTPQPVKLNSKSLWSYDQLRLWGNNGCPSRDSAEWKHLLNELREIKQ